MKRFFHRVSKHLVEDEPYSGENKVPIPSLAAAHTPAPTRTDMSGYLTDLVVRVYPTRARPGEGNSTATFATMSAHIVGYARVSTNEQDLTV